MMIGPVITQEKMIEAIPDIVSHYSDAHDNRTNLTNIAMHLLIRYLSQRYVNWLPSDQARRSLHQIMHTIKPYEDELIAQIAEAIKLHRLDNIL